MRKSIKKQSLNRRKTYSIGVSQIKNVDIEKFRCYATHDNNTLSQSSDSTLTAGFLADCGYDDIIQLRRKIHTKNLRTCSPPPLLLEIQKLRFLFPDFPIKMLNYLIIRYDGNCAKTKRYLIKNGWECNSKRRCMLTNKSDIHFTTNYYYGNLSSKEVKKILKNEKQASYITIYRYNNDNIDDNKFKYYICYKTRTKIIEKPIKVPNVPDILKTMLKLKYPVVSYDKQVNINLLPCSNKTLSF